MGMSSTEQEPVPEVPNGVAEDGATEENGQGEMKSITKKEDSMVNNEEENKKVKKKQKKKKGVGEDGMGALAGGFEIIGVRERHGKFRKAVPIMPLPVAVFLCVVNVLLPGIGTLVSAFVVFCGGKTEYEKPSQAFTYNIVAFFLQLITLPILVGWIWSIIWGVTFVTIAAPKANAEKNTTPAPEHV